MIHTYLNTVLTRSTGGVYRRKTSLVSLNFVTTLLAEDTLDLRKLLKRFFNVGSIGPLFLKMHTNTASAAINVSTWEGYQREI
jgi:hypothetical protein